MTDQKKSIDRLLSSLQERAKELNCLYQVEEILGDPDARLEDICPRILKAIPPGWQYSDVCQAKISIYNKEFASPDFRESSWVQSADIVVQDESVGSVSVYYIKEMPPGDDGPFLKEESRLIKTVAERLSHFLLHQKMHRMVVGWESALHDVSDGDSQEWRVVLRMLRLTDRNLYIRISRKLLNYLCWSGINEAEKLIKTAIPDQQSDDQELLGQTNEPRRRNGGGQSADLSTATFKIAAEHLNSDEILSLIRKWIQEDKLSFLVQIVNRNLSLSDVADAIRRYYHLAVDDPDASSPNERGIQVSLIRRFLSDQLPYINVIKHYIEIKDFYYLLQNVIFSTESHGRLGGKSAGLYMAGQILKKKACDFKILADVKIPKTWHVTSDILLHFMHHNDFEEVVEQKYKEINQIRLEYPHIVETFKRARFPADIAQGLSVALDDFGDNPLIVRSSSLLEDRAGAAFSGKYKSLFLANQGSKRQRLEALMDAIAEVYASTFSPDPIEYRAERGLLDFGEEMGIMIQEVVGKRIGKYYLPAYAGVAFSNNEFRWSPRIKRDDGLIRMVPGLGTRAVDRLSDDYPVLLAPGQPGLRVNVDPDEMIRYSPKKIDVIDLDTNSFKTIDIREFIREVGYEIPAINNLVSVFRDGHISLPMGMNIDFDKDELLMTFEGLISKTPFIKQMHIILKTLEETLGYPVDIEFASDGNDFYLLQCRPQSYSGQSKPSPIPKDIDKDRILFSANRYISNGRVPDITHIVYIKSDSYAALSEHSDLLAVGRVVSRLNRLLPKRQFVLMGPGRWGSRGDIKLGVSVTYSDINNTACLIEIARQKGNYIPDLSFGTHFFQDLVEAGIRYLPLYPDDEGILFNMRFLTGSKNILSDVLPEFTYLSDTIHLIDIPKNTDGKVMRILMNADLDEAIGILTRPSSEVADVDEAVEAEVKPQDRFWRWRYQMVERIAHALDPAQFGVAGFYVFGSTKNASAGPGSDIDILIHFRGDADQKEKLTQWLTGWSLCLSEVNYLRTGYHTDGLLDIHFVNDEDIANKTSYAAKIGAITDPVRPLPMMKPTDTLK